MCKMWAVWLWCTKCGPGLFCVNIIIAPHRFALARWFPFRMTVTELPKLPAPCMPYHPSKTEHVCVVATSHYSFLFVFTLLNIYLPSRLVYSLMRNLLRGNGDDDHDNNMLFNILEIMLGWESFLSPSKIQGTENLLYSMHAPERGLCEWVLKTYHFIRQ